VLSSLHEALVGIVDEQPHLIATMLSGIDVPALRGDASIQSVREKLGAASPPELRADGVLQVNRDGKTVLIIVVEVQLATDPNKLYSWPAYVTGARPRPAPPAWAPSFPTNRTPAPRPSRTRKTVFY